MGETDRSAYNQGEDKGLGDKYDAFKASWQKKQAESKAWQDRNTQASDKQAAEEDRRSAETREKFKNFLKQNPGASFLVDRAIPSMAAANPVGALSNAAQWGISKLRGESPTLTPTDAKAQEPAETGRSTGDLDVTNPSARATGTLASGTSPYMLPDAKNLAGVQLGTRGGGGADDLEGMGTMKRLVTDKKDELADTEGLLAKQTEAGGAHFDAEKAAADIPGFIAQGQREAFKKVADSDKETGDELKKMDDNIARANDDVAAMGVDPGRLFRSKDVPFRLSMLVGAVAGGMLSGLTGQPNQFMDHVRGMVRDDVNAQEQGIAQGQRRLKGMETAYERMRMRGVDRNVAAWKQYDVTLQSLQNELQGKLAQAKLPEIKANIEANLQQLQIERDKVATGIDEYFKRVRDARNAAAAAAAAQAFHMAMETKKIQLEERKVSAEELKARGEYEKNTGEATQKLDQNFLPAMSGGAYVQDEIKDANGNVIGYKQAGTLTAAPEERKELAEKRRTSQEMLGRLETLATKRAAYQKAVATVMNPGSSPVDKARAAFEAHKLKGQLEAEGGQLTTAFGSSNHLGALDKGYVDFANKTLGDPTSLDPQAVSKTSQLIEDTKKKIGSVDENGGMKAVRVVDAATGRHVIKPMGGFSQASPSGRPEDLPGVKIVK